MSDSYNTSSNASGGGSAEDFLGDFHDKKLLEVLENNVQLKQFAIDKTVAIHNGLTITFHTIDSFDEGVRLSTEYSDPEAGGITGSTKTATVVQFGDKKIITELLEASAIVSLVEEAQVRFGYAAARTLDKYIQRVLLTGSNPAAGAAISTWFSSSVGQASGMVANYSAAAQSDTSLKLNMYKASGIEGDAGVVSAVFSAVTAPTTANTPKVASIREIVTQLKMNNVRPYSDGNYALVVTPKDAAAIRSDEDFEAWNRYNNAEKMFKGEVGMVEGVRIVESTNLVNLKNGQDEVANDVYVNFAFGAQCFTLTELSGKHGIKSMYVPFSTKDHSNTLQLIASIGWKYTGACAVLDGRQGIALASVYEV